MNKNQLLKYSFFAIAEVMLVVIGILIALALDNRDKNENNQRLEQQYYQSMKNQLGEDKQSLLGEIRYNDLHLSQFKSGIDIIARDDRGQMLKLADIAIKLKNSTDFRRKSSIYQTLVNSGEIKHITNRTIIEKLQSLEGEYAYIERLESIHRVVSVENIIPTLIEIIRLVPFGVEKPELLYDFRIQNMLVLIVGLMQEKNQVYLDAIKTIDLTLVLIDKTIEQEISR